MQMNKSTFKFKNLLRLSLLILCGLIIGVNVYLINSESLVGEQLPMPFGYGAAVVLSGSMEPAFSKGDLIIVKKTTQYAEKDIVVFQDGSVLVVHRIIEMDDETVTTKGDENNMADNPIPHSAVKGKVLFHIRYAGQVVEFFKTPIGTVCMIAVAIALVEIPRRREKKKDDEQRQQIVDEIKKLMDK